MNLQQYMPSSKNRKESDRGSIKTEKKLTESNKAMPQSVTNMQPCNIRTCKQPVTPIALSA